jgi:hypothetical protein
VARVAITVLDDQNGRLIPLELDAVPEERHQAGAIATENEVEVGVNITDHVRPTPRTVTLQAVISDTPIGPDGGTDATVELGLPARKVQGLATREGGQPRAGRIEDEPAGQTYGIVFQPDAAPTRVADAWRVLMDARERSLLVLVQTPLETYEPAALLNVETVRTARDFSWLNVSLTFREINRVATETVPVPARTRDRRQVDRGSQQTTASTPRLRSAAVQILHGLGVGGF